MAVYFDQRPSEILGVYWNCCQRAHKHQGYLGKDIMFRLWRGELLHEILTQKTPRVGNYSWIERNYYVAGYCGPYDFFFLKWKNYISLSLFIIFNKCLSEDTFSDYAKR